LISKHYRPSSKKHTYHQSKYFRKHKGKPDTSFTKKAGKISIPIPINTTPRKTAITIEPEALPIEVKKLVTKILNPFIKKA
ncbi:hypothetical protein, partial [Capnocytophaga granulosa]